MTEDTERFEKFLKNKQQFIKDMLLVVHNELVRADFETQLALVEDIIHHYNVLVKGEISNGIGVNNEN